LTLLLPILKMIEEGLTASEIAKKLNRNKQLVSYHIRNLEKCGYIKENGRDVFKLLELAQPGKNFLDQYTTIYSNSNAPIWRLENIRFKARVYKMPPTDSLDWKKTEMNNWVQYGSQVDNITVHLNNGKNPTLEFFPSPIDGDDPYKLRDKAFYDCIKASEKLEETFRIEIGRPEQSTRPEYVVYHPVAKAITKHIGQVKVEGIGKVNASGPRHSGEFEFDDPRAAAEFLVLPKRVENVEEKMYTLEQEMNEMRSILLQQRQQQEVEQSKTPDSSTSGEKSDQ
jgi:predicted transcriptional regulator